MELESLIHQNNGVGLLEGLEDSTFSCSFGTRFLPEKFQDIDFSFNYKIHNPKIYSEASRKNILGFPSLNKSGEDEIESLVETRVRKLETMTSNFPGNDDLFAWSNEFKLGLGLGKCNGSMRSQIKPGEGAFELCDSTDDSSGIKRKFWELSDLSKKYESQETETERKKLKKTETNTKNREAAGSKMPPWHVEVIEDMAADLDGSLSNLGADLAAGSYNMSEALLSLPSLTVFKQEAPSPSQENLMNPPNLQQNVEEGQEQNSTLHRLLQQSNFHNHLKRSNSSNKPMENSEKKNEDCRFQYVLAAATSIATKVTEETLTYLNQGQSYEIKLKKVGELSNFRGKILKSIIRICFHERRLQYMEKEQILAWQASRPGERIIELDVPLSYGLFDVEQDPNMLNMVSFLWNPTKEVGAYIKVNCISTEFTPKKHGGEKGVPFRIQVETFIEGETTRLHAAACQIKVFKLKGADRKHKQDREKILKRPLSEQDKYQPSYECTVLSDLPPEAVFPVLGSLNSPTGAAPIRNNSIYPSVESRFLPDVYSTYSTSSVIIGDVVRSVEQPKQCGLIDGREDSKRPLNSKQSQSTYRIATITVIINDVEFSLNLCHTVKPILDRERIRFQVLERRIEKGVRRKCKKKGGFRKNIRSGFQAKRIWETFKIDSCLIPHGHLRTSISSPGKVENNPLPESGNEKRRSPAPLPTDGSSSPAAHLSPDSSPQQTAQWLRKNSFGNYVCTFANFSGADILRLTRDDLIQICGLADGIRLLYALHSKAIVRLTLYVCTPNSAVYHAVYLDHMGRNEMSRKLAKLLGVQQNQIHDIFLQGPNDIRVLVTDEVINNIRDESMFSVEILKDENRGRFILLLKPVAST